MTALLILLQLFGAPDQEQQVADGILWLVTPERRSVDRPYRGGRAAVDPEFRLALSRGFIKAAQYWDLPVYLLVATAYRESVFDPSLAGDWGRSLGLLQVGPQGRRRCKEFCGDVHSIDGGAMCGACWLNEGVDWCGDIAGGTTAYCCGSCKPTSVRCERARDRKLRLLVLLKGLENEK
jgi:hypothetical protein